MASSTARNASHAGSAKDLAAESRHAAEGGAKDMREMAVAMTEFKEASASVAKIVKTIDEIAFQTNILALNAAVEAARAGEAGLGFAVVAEEVRNLAQRSARAAQETAATVERTIQRSERGFQLSQKVLTMLESLVGKVREVDDFVGRIATASNEQNQGIGGINAAVGEMDAITQRTAASAEETASASEELNAQAEVLKETVARLVVLIEGTGSARHVSAAHSDHAVEAAAHAFPDDSRPRHPAPVHARTRARQPVGML